MNSLNKRLLWVSLFALVAFLTAAGLALERTFNQSLQQARQDRLQAHLFSLLAAAELQPVGLVVSASHPNERLFTPGSGLYAQILDAQGEVSWSSQSLLGVNVNFERVIEPGKSRFYYLPTPASSQPLFVHAYGVAWQEPNRPEREFTLIIAEDQSVFYDQLNGFRNSLWTSLVLVAVILLAALALVVRWGLAPLRKVERDLAEMESGHTDFLHGNYPEELRGLTQNLNKLIHNERSRMQHYRNTLANLAHSLKTPLAVMRNGLNVERDAEMLEQVERMNKLVEYQLQRATATGQATFATPIQVCPLIEKLLNSLDKVYRENQVSTSLRCDALLEVRADEGDLMELFGNLLDNAYKWCRGSVDISVCAAKDNRDTRNSHIEIHIQDDGPGIPEGQVTRVQKRGERNDTQTQGQGIGLAVVADIVNAYRGEIQIDRSEIGGACVRIKLPIK